MEVRYSILGMENICNV